MLHEEMTAISIAKAGGPDVLEPVKIAVPKPGDDQLLVKVEAAGVNRPDVLQRQGLYPAPPGASEIPGLEVAGEIAEAGISVSRYKVGEKVCALVSGGGYAEYCLADEATALPIPEGLSVIEASALPETFFTVWHNVYERGQLQSGEWLLVHGGTSGIGTTAIQLATALGSKVIATAGSDEKCATCVKLGAIKAINYRKADFVEAVKEITEGHGADVILDMVGGDYIERNFKAAAPDGRIVQIAFLKGSKAEVNFMRLMLKRLTFTGSTLRSQTTEFKGRLSQDLENNVWPLIGPDKIKPLIDSTFSLENARDAHARMESNEHMGKIVLTV